MKTIPEELLEQLEQGNVLLFIGEHIVRDAAGEVAFEQLAAQLVVRAGIADGEGISFAEIAQLYEDQKGLHELLLFVKSYFEGLGNRPQPVHRLIAGLTDCTVLATTCFDGRLEQAFEEARRPLNPIIGNVDVAFEEERQTQLYKLRGSLERIESLILTEDAYETFFEQHASISLVLQGYLARKTILFVGYDLTDPHFKRLYRKVTAPLDQFTRRAYAFGAALPAHIANWAKRRQIELIEADVTLFFESLTAQLAARKAIAPVAPELFYDAASLLPEPLPERPYKFLDYYEAKDAGIFYGRQQETQHLCALIHAHRLVLLYGASGVGKTSLLLAGAVPRLEQATPPYETIYIRALENPSVVIRRTLRRQLPDANLPNEGSLVDFLAAVTTELGQTLVIILDQFEEFFIRLSPQFRAAFISELGVVYDATDVPVKLLFSLREDWLASMDEIEARIPDLFRTRMRVSRLTETQAHQAITAPVERLGISYEPALLERLLVDLLGSNQEVMPPQLQLVCSALYDGRREDDRVLKVATYERLGGVQGVLHCYLEEEFSRLEPAEQTLARAILEELVTSEKTKAVKSSTELALALEVKLRILVPLLEWLVRGRLLRALKQETGHRAYELAHEYLIHEISLTAESQARKQAEELIQQEVENWQRFGTVLAADKLALIGEVGDLLRTGDDAQALLLQSALQVGQDVEYWLNRIPEPTRRVELLTQATRSKLTIVRQRAAETLGTQDLPDSVAPLLTLALHDRNMDVRDTARQSLAQLTTQQPAIVERLKDEVARSAERENTTDSTRAALLRTLTYLPLKGLPFTLRMDVLMMRIRLRMTSFIEASFVTPQRRAMAMTTGLLVVLVALAYVFSANSYHLQVASSEIWDGHETIVISQGHPWLPSMGLEKEMVDTGIERTQIKDRQTRDDIEKSRGFWQDHDGGEYRKWGKQVSEVLKLEDRVQMLWYLGEEKEAFQAIVAAMTSQDTELHPTSVVLFEQIVRVEPQLVEAKPQLAEQVLQAVLPLLEHEEWQVSQSAASAVRQVVQANPQLAEQLIAALLPLLKNEEENLRSRALFAVGQVGKANPQLAEQVIPALLRLLEHEEGDVRASAAFAVGQVVEANSQLAEQVLAALLPQLSDEEDHIRASAAFAVGQVVGEANPQLAEQVLQALQPLLSDEEGDVRASAASTVGQVVEAHSQLATEPVLQALQPLLSDEEGDVRASAASAVGQVVEAHSQLATEPVMDALLRLLEDDKHSGVRASAASAVGLVGKAHSQLATEPVMDALLPLLEDEDSYVSNSAASALGQLVKANPQLVTEQVLQALLPLLKNGHRDVPNGALFAVAQVVEANPQLVTEQVITALLTPLENQHISVSDNPASAVGQMVKANPQLAEQVIAALRQLLEDEEWYVRNSAVFMVGQVVEGNPQLAERVLQALLPLLEHENNDVRSHAASAMGQALAAKPKQAQQHLKKLFDWLSGSDFLINEGLTTCHLTHALAANADLTEQQYIDQIKEHLLSNKYQGGFTEYIYLDLGKVLAINHSYAKQVIPSLRPLLENLQAHSDAVLMLSYAYTHEELPALLEKLTDPRNTLERSVAARALFLITLQEPNRDADIREALQKLSNSTEPMERIWANKTLAMLDRATEEATNRLQTPYPSWHNDESRCGTAYLFDEEISLFGEEFTWAAGQAFTSLEEQTNKENGQTVTK